MSYVLDTAQRTVSGSASTVRFERYASTGFGRRMTVNGEPAYDLTPLCDTCDFIFRREEGASETSLHAEPLTSALREGLASLDETTLARASAAIPRGDYRVVLFDAVPQLVAPGDEHDYFTHEGREMWPHDPFDPPSERDIVHDPKVPYYRTGSRRIAPDAMFFEFVVPMFPPARLNEGAVREHRERVARGAHPTALALSILDVRQPADWEGDPEITKHWCLAHFILDGNHRVYAAATAGAPARILAFVSLEWSIATPEEIDEAIEGLGEVWTASTD